MNDELIFAPEDNENYKDPSSLIESDYSMPGRYIFSEIKYRF